MTIEELHREIDRNWSKHLSSTRKLLRVPSVSATGEGIQETADLIENTLRGFGAKTKQFRANKKSHPLVYGRLDVGASATLAMYGMYDVQPVGDPDEWDHPPFGATIVKKKPYGEILVNRGVYNSKASLAGSLLAIETMVEKDQLPVNLHFLIEGEEESGGLSLSTFVTKNKVMLSDADAGVWFDYSEDSNGEVDISLGSKGCVSFDLLAEGNEERGPMNGAVHSSVAVIVESPVLRLIKAVHTFVDENQNLAIDSIWDDVIPPPDEDLKLTEQLAKRFEREPYLKELGVKTSKVAGTDIDLLRKYMFEPSVNVSGLLSGYVGEGYSTVLPGKALAKVDIRTVPNMTIEGTRERVKEHLRRRGFSDVKMHSYEDYPWSKVPFDADIVQASIEAMRYHGKEPRVWPMTAGSAPMFVFDQILGIPHGGTGLGFGGKAHAPNEYAVVKGMKEFEKSVITMLHKYAEMASGNRNA